MAGNKWKKCIKSVSFEISWTFKEKFNSEKSSYYDQIIEINQILYNNTV